MFQNARIFSKPSRGFNNCSLAQQVPTNILMWALLSSEGWWRAWSDAYSFDDAI